MVPAVAFAAKVATRGLYRSTIDKKEQLFFPSDPNYKTEKASISKKQSNSQASPRTQEKRIYGAVEKRGFLWIFTI
jgi:hypothetical protein